MAKMSDNIEEYFAKIEGTKEQFHSRELFKAGEEDIDLKTDLTNEEIGIITTLFFNDSFLKKKGLKPLFINYYYKFMRLKVSKDRKSRGEFVSINRSQSPDDLLNTANNLKNLTDVRK